MLCSITISDLPQVFDLCDRINEQMRFGEMGYPYSHEAMTRSWPKVIADPHHICFCHKTLETVDGIFLARLQDSSYFMKNHLVAYEIANHADPALNHVAASRIMIDLRHEAERRMMALKVKSFFLSTHPEQVGGMEANLDRNGYRLIGRYRVKEFDHGIS